MVYALVNPHVDRPIRNLLDGCAGALEHTLKIVSYPWALTRRDLPAGTYLFADLDRVPRADWSGVRDLAAALAESGAARVVNDPRHVLLRYPLLRRLYERGVNDFRVYRADDDFDRVRFPVFVRCEHDHGGPRTPLIHTRRELASTLARLGRHRSWRRQLMVTECVATPDADGLFRKYGALLVNGRVIASHLIAARTWMVKGKFRVVTPAIASEEFEYVRDNPHAARLAAIFDLAGIEYGRIDYGFAAGRLQVYEINTNPTVMGRGQARHTGRRPKRQILVDRLVGAFTDLDRPMGPVGGDRSSIAVPPRPGALPSWAYRGLRSTQALWRLYAHRSGIHGGRSTWPSSRRVSAPRARADGPDNASAPAEEIEHADEGRGVDRTEVQPQP